MEYIPTSRLKPADWNPRILYTKEFHQLIAMIRTDPTFLEARPILATQDGTIYAGAQRYRAILQLYREGWDSPWGYGLVPAILHDIPEEQAKARALRDNNHAGHWQEIELAEVLTEIAAASGEDLLPTLGFNDDELQNILAAAGIADPVNPVTGRTIQEPQNSAQKAQEPSEGHSGTSTHVAHGEPLTVVLRFPTLVGWDHACWMLEHDQRLGHDGLTAYDEKGHTR